MFVKLVWGTNKVVVSPELENNLKTLLRSRCSSKGPSGLSSGILKLYSTIAVTVFSTHSRSKPSVLELLLSLILSEYNYNKDYSNIL